MDILSKQKLFDKIHFNGHGQNETCEETEMFLKTNTFISDWLYEVFSTGYIKGDNLLDIGTGPCLNSVVYATKYFHNIYLSDLSVSNRTYLDEWYNGEHRTLMRHFFEEAAKREDLQTAEEKEKELIRKIDGILFCDVSQENPLRGNEEPVPKQFDAITTCWCINHSARSAEEYERILRNICSLIKPGGHLVLMGINVYTDKHEQNNTTSSLPYFDAEQTKKFFDTPYMRLTNWKFSNNIVPFGDLYNIVAEIV